MYTLYYSPAAMSFTAHVALREAGLDFDLHEVSIPKGQQRAPDYLAVHPLGRVPALRLPSGDVLTETPAILGFIADAAPDRALLPTEAWPRARAAEWMSLFASALHPAFMGFFDPRRFGDSPAVQAALPPDSRLRFRDLLSHVDFRLGGVPYAVGGRHSLCDVYASTFFMWARFFEFPVRELPGYASLFERVAGRPAFDAALEREGLKRLGGHTVSSAHL